MGLNLRRSKLPPSVQLTESLYQKSIFVNEIKFFLTTKQMYSIYLTWEMVRGEGMRLKTFILFSPGGDSWN